MKRLSLIIVVAALSIACSAANATLFSFTTSLNGAQEVPLAVTPATGVGSFLFDDQAMGMSCSVNFYDLLAPSVASHLHRGAAGVNGPVVFTLTGGTGSTSGAYFGYWDSMTAADVADLFAGNLYVNVHSTIYPGGEIRGQLRSCNTAVPELPASLLALIPGMLALIRRRR